MGAEMLLLDTLCKCKPFREATAETIKLLPHPRGPCIKNTGETANGSAILNNFRWLQSLETLVYELFVSRNGTIAFSISSA